MEVEDRTVYRVDSENQRAIFCTLVKSIVENFLVVDLICFALVLLKGNTWRFYGHRSILNHNYSMIITKHAPDVEYSICEETKEFHNPYAPAFIQFNLKLEKWFWRWIVTGKHTIIMI